VSINNFVRVLKLCVLFDDVEGLTVNGDLTVDTNVLYVDSTNNKVGIGTTSPSVDLETLGSGGIKTGNASGTGLFKADGGSTKVGSFSNHRFDLITNNTTRASIDTSGKVGIGTTSPSVDLETLGSGGIKTGNASGTGLFKADGGSTKVGSFSNHRFDLITNNTTRASIDTSGKVGIGTTSPTSSLHVYHATTDTVANFESGDSSVAVNFTASDNSMQIATSSTDGIIKNNGAGNFRLFNNGSEKARIDSSGKLGIGTTSPGVSLDVGSLTDAIRVPNGSTGQRPTAALGQLRYNTTTSEFEGYAAGAWGKIGGGGDSFGTIAVSGQTNIVAEQENDTLTIVGAGGITATTTAGTDTLTLTGQTSVNPYTPDFFTTANNSTTAFTLSVTPPSEDNLIVFMEGVYQNKNSYTLSGTTLTLNAAPASGTEVVVHIIQNGVVGAASTVNVVPLSVCEFLF
jgi:hypothetical protein